MPDSSKLGSGGVNTTGRTGAAKVNDWAPEDTRILHILASVLANQKREESAIALLEYALNKEPENNELKQALSGAYLLIGHFAESLDMADKSLAGGAKGIIRERLLLVRSQALWGLERREEARAAMAHYLSERQKP
jgi:tetratricopeptide (TPR) repeat protein